MPIDKSYTYNMKGVLIKTNLYYPIINNDTLNSIQIINYNKKHISSVHYQSLYPKDSNTTNSTYYFESGEIKDYYYLTHDTTFTISYYNNGDTAMVLNLYHPVGREQIIKGYSISNC